MNFMRRELIFLTLAAICISFTPLAAADEASSKRHNVLFIAVDDLNHWVEGLSNYPHAKTPNITKLAQRGVMFTNAHCAAPACNPSRASVMTGISPANSGVYVNSQDWRQCENLKNAVTLPQHFRDHGYRVLGGGKIYHAANLSTRGLEGYLDPKPWHEYFPSKSRQLADEFTPPNQAVNGSNQFYKGRMDWDQLDIDDSEMGDAKVMTWAENQLSKSHDAPLFLAVGLYRPHIPWYTPKKWFDEYPIESIELPVVQTDDLSDVPDAGQAMSRRAWQEWIKGNGKWKEAVQGYLASVSFADAMVGRLLTALDNGPHADNTVIVLWSDHGYHLGHKEHWEKFALWEQTTHVPLIVVDPESNQAGGRCERPVSLLDVYPTLIDLCDVNDRPGLDGRSLRPFLNHPHTDSDRAVVTTQGRGNHAVRSQDWRYIRYADGSEELYDHQTDPNEFTNLAGDAKYKSVKQHHAKHLPATDAPMSPMRQPKK